MTLSRPRTTRRVLRGSALGLGLLVAGGFTAPAAFAVEDTTTDQAPAETVESPAPLQEAPAEESPAQEDPIMAPALSGDFGMGKNITVQVEHYGPVPSDLSLAGAEFQLTPQAPLEPSEGAPDTLREEAPAAPAATCTTDADGRCTFHSIFTSQGSGRPATGLLPGSYDLTQVSASPGLAPATGSATAYVCFVECADTYTGTVGNDSLFRTSLVTTVTDVDTDEPLACAGYELTGPDYPHVSEVRATPVIGTVPAECLTPTTAPTTSADPSTTAPTTTVAPTTTAPETTDPDDTVSPTNDTTSPSTTSPTSAPVTINLAPAAAETPLVTFGTQVSDSTGTMTFPGWFLPGDGYLLSPTTTPAGYAPDVTDGFSITTTPQQAAALEPAAVVRTLATGLAAGAPAPATTTGAAGVAAATTTAAAAGVTTTAATAAEQAALATTGTPVGTMVLLGTGLVALGGGALATGSVLRRRARSNA